MFTFEGMHHGEVRNYPGFCTIPKDTERLGFPITAPSFASVVSAMVVLTAIAPGTQQGFALGTSNSGILCAGVIDKGRVGISQLKGLAKKLIEMTEESLPSLSDAEAAYFQALLDSAKADGLDMPFHGRIPID